MYYKNDIGVLLSVLTAIVCIVVVAAIKNTTIKSTPKPEVLLCAHQVLLNRNHSAILNVEAFTGWLTLKLASLQVVVSTVADGRLGTYIGDAAFGWCDRLRDINIPKGVTEFTKHVIAHTNFQTFELPENIESIGVGSFMECNNLLGVTIPSKVKLIDEGAFIDVPNLQFVSVRSAEPPSIKGETLDRYDLTLYVPLNCKAAYQEAPHWKNFPE